MAADPGRRRTRHLVVLVLAAALVNLPLLHSSWTDRRVERSGVDVQATVVDHATVGDQHLLTFRFPESLDPEQRSWQADVDPTTYDLAVDTGGLGVRVLADQPAAYRADGQVDSNVLLVVTLVADALLLLVALMLWRYGGRGRRRLEAVAVADVERSAPGSALDLIGGETYLVRGEVSVVEPDHVVLDLGDRSVRVRLDGHRNPVGHQQPAQVRARLL